VKRYPGDVRDFILIWCVGIPLALLFLAAMIKAQ
jgi:hypothetical protein